MNLTEIISRHCADTRSILLWIESLRYEMANSKIDNENENALKKSLESKLQTLQADAFAVANHFSDVAAAFDDPLIMQDLLEELKA